MNHILDFAYRRLPKEDQLLLSRIAAFRFSMSFDALKALEVTDENTLKKRLSNLVDRGLLLYSSEVYRYDLHPIVRQYCYDLLIDKKQTHIQLGNYFASIPEPDEVASLGDLRPVIELYHHTVSAGLCYQAARLYRQRLHNYIYHRFCSYATCIELLSALLVEGEDELLKTREGEHQPFVLSCLASAYSLAGKPRLACSLQQRCMSLTDDVNYSVIFLWNIAYNQILLGNLEEAENTLKRVRKIFKSEQWRNEKEFWGGRMPNPFKLHETMRSGLLALVLSYKGDVKGSKRLFNEALRDFVDIKDFHHACCILHWLCQQELKEEPKDTSLRTAVKAYEMAKQAGNNRDKVISSWLLGAAQMRTGNLVKAEEYLQKAIVHCRRIGLMEVEALVLLDLARLRDAQKKDKKDLASRKELDNEALELAKEALDVTCRCEYLLQQADVHNFLARLYFDSQNMQTAHEHANAANECASNGYKAASQEAEHLQHKIEEYIEAMKNRRL